MSLQAAEATAKSKDEAEAMAKASLKAARVKADAARYDSALAQPSVLALCDSCSASGPPVRRTGDQLRQRRWRKR
jgi:hypothetical protein